MKNALRVFVVLLAASLTAQANTFVVNSLGDQSDSNAGDGICATSTSTCTLRAAIQEANALAGTDTITFSLGSGSPEIVPTSGLPFITTPVIINGATGGATRIVITGSSAGSSYGLVVGTGSDGSQISSLVIRSFNIDGLVLANSVTVQNCVIQTNNNDGIRVDGNNNVIGGITAGTGNVISGNTHYGVHLILSASGNQIQGNRIGVDASGTAALGNGYSGVYLDCTSGNNVTNNTIGGASAAARNIISGNNIGIQIQGSGATGNNIQGNYIGTDVNGSTAIGSSLGQGISLNANNNVIGGTTAGTGNVISGNGTGVFLRDASGNQIQGNLIGVNASGTAALGNTNGVSVSVSTGTSTNNTIGGTSPAARNIISGNVGSGVVLDGSGTTGNNVQGNYIGTDINGTTAIGGTSVAGVSLRNGANHNTIGGTVAGAGNVISGNKVGVLFRGNNPRRNVVQGNFIGTDSSGTKRLGNISDGIYFDGSNPGGAGSGNTIGGATAGAANIISANGNNGINIEDGAASLNAVQGNFIGTDSAGTANLGNAGNGIYIASPGNEIGVSGPGNTIAFNGARGITITNGATGNGILGNSIFSNGSLGIDLNDDGVTPNDAGDADTGANNLQNYPVLTSATYDSATNTTVVQGTLNSTPGASFTLEFFSSPAADPTLYGEGQTFRGSTSVTTNGVGDLSFTVTLNAPVPGGQVITATATDASYNTSEFSKAVLVTGPSPTPTPTPTPTATPTPTPTPTPPSQLQNLSTRKQVGAGDNVLIGGFIVVGTDDKKVLLRGLGPSLPVNGALADPTLELHRADTTLLAFNDNWREASNASEIQAILPPPDDRESAILTSLTAKPGSQGGAGYTGVLAGKGGTTGIGLLEIYDLANAANSKLANISTRGFVGTGDDLLIGGFIPGPSGRTPLKVLVRALGPSLANQGVSGALQDPVLELHDANGTLLVNDNWRDASNAAEIQATLPPPDNRESAIITTLAPATSGYTAVVRGAGGSTGVALVEVYALQ